jgi:hypothetical protein
MLDKADELLLYVNVAIPKTRTLLGDKLCDMVRKATLTEERLNEHTTENPYVQRIVQLIAKLRSEKCSGYQTLRLVQTLDEYMVFSETGNLSYHNFINFVVKWSVVYTYMNMFVILNELERDNPSSCIIITMKKEQAFADEQSLAAKIVKVPFVIKEKENIIVFKKKNSGKLARSNKDVVSD